MDWGKPLNDVQRLVKEERVIQARLDNYSFDYNDIWAARERVRTSKSLSDINVLQRDKKRVVARLRKFKRGLLNPNSTTMQVLDLLTLLALGFTVLVTPYEVGLILNPITSLDYANYVVNVIFFLGIITQFFLPYHEKAQEGGRLVRSHSRIAKRYVLGSFFVDVVSTIPFSDLAPLLMSGEQSSKELQLLRMLRAVRLLKLGRIFRASRILVSLADLLEQWFDFSRTEVLELARLADGTCERGHGDCLSACEQELLSTIMAKSVEVINQAEVWWCHAIASGAIPPEAVGPQHFELYLFVLGHAELEHMVIPSNRAEYATNFVCQFIMLIVSNIFVGVVANAQAEANPLDKAHKARLDHLNHLLDSVRAPQDLKRRTREYLRCTKDLVAMQGFTDLYDLFSPKLRGDLLGFISNKLLKNVPFFESCEPGFMRELSLKLSHVGYEAGDRVKLAEPTLCIVSRGTAVLGGKPISINQFWGEDMVVTSKALRDSRIAVALTYIEIVTLSRSDLFELMESWDESAKQIRIAALKISMIRAPQIIANYLKHKAIERRGGGDPTPRMLVDEANRLETALKNIGPNSKFEYREYHEVMKRINGALPLRGFAVEQRFSADVQVASLAVAALNVAGDDGRLLLDEAGQVVNRSGETVKVA
ncbi:voltage-gated ion channel superfamily [Chrysochromulina tobinii]|uniref:Voltage-gated ion channel superfamily n=1 Tax=Chrysochromulina tobinii TaxID=1460289 RepID=A0A0M0JCT6_9EUKA|nr:voltage-gated ion channel superfamily [Chrysochromulina tobinii]|eukprot:KOO24295.1 voltage-gated ion channel superfamily [Chrysochromulina sp. CCMP291]